METLRHASGAHWRKSLPSWLFLTLFSLFLSSPVFSQEVVITGKVVAADGETLPGVSVKVKNSTTTTTTDINGNYRISAPGTATLVFSFVGFAAQEVAVNGRSTVDVRLSADTKSLEEVVVVGYGTQKRVNLTGSLSTVSGETLTQRPAPNAANLLQGRVTGLQVTQPSSEPGRDNPQFLIRGRGSFGGSTNPLVLIDGVNGSLNNLSPNDIENITVLKDASSAAIYGSRAANGVILVTTKKGKKGTPEVNYSMNIGQHTAIGLPDLITNSADYMEMYNMAAARSGLNTSTYYAQSEIDKYRNSTDRNQYPNFDAIDYYFKPATVTNHNLSLSGANEQTNYNLSLGYLDQKAFFKQYDFKRYNALLNYSNKVNKNITVGTNMNLTYRNREEPPVRSEFMALTVYATGPLYGPYLPDGSGRVVARAYNFEGRNRNVSEYYLMGDQQTKEYNLNGQAYMDLKFLKDFTWSSKVAVNYGDEFFKMHQVPYDVYLLQERDAVTGDYLKINGFGPDILGVTDQYSKTITTTFYSTLNYNKTIAKDHNIGALAGYEQLSTRFRTLRARRQNTIAPAIDEISGYTTTNEFVNFNPTHPRLPSLSDPYEWALQSVFGRVNYNYKGKYLIEGNLRYDGTSKVSPDYRWGLFPSASVGWNVAQEDFVRNKFNWINNLKLRASYGTLGNQDVAVYLYQNTISSGSSYPFGNTTPQAAALVNSFRDQSLRWESTSVADIGLDFSAWRGLLGITFDWFNKKTFDILAPQPIPLSLGLDAPTFNLGKLRNRGFELELSHQNKLGDFSYGFNGQLSRAKNKILELKVPSLGSTIRDVGYEIDGHYLYEWDGIFQESDISSGSYPKHALNPNPKAGDLKMKDLDGNGTVDAADRTFVKGAYPDYIYSFGLNAGYKNWGFSAFFQGVQGVKSRQTGWGVDPFTQGTAPTEKWRNAWTPTNPSNTLPAIYAGSYVGVTSYQSSTFFLSDASYLRLKNVVLSYNLPQKLLSRVKSKSAQVYVSADNLFTITDFEFGDPERAGISTGTPPYPQARIFSAGLNVKF
ncbi:SusC/RagA family TonB-linked outer membrane protein [Desertivirga arenae]|uniref:SusC/RagA family TonB-linked outer membrane protein n=1 Tax=Desertivirga arenae TaxID=2810309 RepID=UPI001A957470|nr:TonB-dependent receptor [Pedobacter sp. SYSU D00823]